MSDLYLERQIIEALQTAQRIATERNEVARKAQSNRQELEDLTQITNALEAKP